MNQSTITTDASVWQERWGASLRLSEAGKEFLQSLIKNEKHVDVSVTITVIEKEKSTKKDWFG